MNRKFGTRAAALTAATGLALAMGACADDDDDDMTNGQDDSAENGMDDDMEDGMDDDMAAMPFGAACDELPEEGEGSLEDMAAQPVATAASTNPWLTNLTMAIEESGMMEDLDAADSITVFAPVDDAFEAIDEEQMDEVMNDEEMLNDLLSYHVVDEWITPEDLATAGPFEAMQGDWVDAEGMDDAFTINGHANVICGDVQTANATVYMIDGVLMPEDLDDMEMED